MKADDESLLSLTRVYEEYKEIMIRCALRITNNKEIAEDAVHNAVLSIIKHKDKLLKLSKQELYTQVVIITKNKCIDLLRKQNYFTDDPIEEIESKFKTDDNPVEEAVINTEMYKSIRNLVASLDETNRVILEMKYLLGMTYKEIGEEMGITAKHVDIKIMRAKEKVRKLMKAGGATDE